MKTSGLLIIAALLLISCTDYYTEPRYDSRNKMEGFYDVEEYSNTFGEYVYYGIHVYKNSRSYSEIYLDDFYAEGVRIYAIVDYDRITIPLQVSKGFEIDGTGIYHRGNLELTYRVRDLYNNSVTDFCETIAYQK